MMSKDMPMSTRDGVLTNEAWPNRTHKKRERENAKKRRSQHSVLRVLWRPRVVAEAARPRCGGTPPMRACATPGRGTFVGRRRAARCARTPSPSSPSLTASRSVTDTAPALDTSGVGGGVGAAVVLRSAADRRRVRRWVSVSHTRSSAALKGKEAKRSAPFTFYGCSHGQQSVPTARRQTRLLSTSQSRKRHLSQWTFCCGCGCGCGEVVPPPSQVARLHSSQLRACSYQIIRPGHTARA